jgi:hypothetical protein
MRRGLVVLWASDLKRAVEVVEHFNGSWNQPCYGGLIAMSESSRELFFLQLSDVAPATNQLLKTYPSRINGNVTVGDVINTYGVSIIFQVSIEVLTDRCKNCGETQFTPPNAGDCRYHRFKKEWREIASGEAKEGTQEALGRADVRVAKWLRKRGIKI